MKRFKEYPRPLLAALCICLFSGFLHGQGRDSSEINRRTEMVLLNELFGFEAHPLELSAGAFMYSRNPSHSYVRAVFDYRKEESPMFWEEGKGRIGGRLESASLLRMKNGSALKGGVAYSKGMKKQVRWNSTSDFMLLYPYVLADSLGGDLQYETYSFHGNYARSSGKLHTAVSGSYRASHEYRKVDPRPRNIVSDFSGTLTLGYLTDRQLFSLNASYRIYNQSQHVKFYNEHGANAIEWHLTGLGNHLPRFAGTSSFVETGYRGQGGRVAAVMQSRPFDGFNAGLSYGLFQVTRHLVAQNEAPITKLSVQEVLSFVSCRRSFSDIAFGASLTGAYELRQGTENIIDNGASGSFHELAAFTMYRSRVFKGALSAVLSWKTAAGVWSLQSGIGLHTSRSDHLFPRQEMRVDKLTFGADAGWWKSSGRWLLAFSAGAGRGRTFRKKFELTRSKEIEACITDHYESLYKKLSDSRFSGRISFRLQRELKTGTALFMRAARERDFFGRKDRSDGVYAAVGLLF